MHQMSLRTKLILLIAALLIAIGLNWPVAWSCIIHQPAPGTPWTPSAQEIRVLWDTHMPNGQRDRNLVTIPPPQDFIGFRRIRILGDGDNTPQSMADPDARNLKIIRAGYPFDCVIYVRHWDTTYDRIEHGMRITPRWIGGDSGTYGVVDVLPCKPIVPGFLFNTLLYFALIVSPFYIVPWMYRWLRTRIHPSWCCQNCGYDLRADTSHRCPECGLERI
jgi:hypothetical protein